MDYMVTRARAVDEQLSSMADQLGHHDSVFAKLNALYSTVQSHSDSFNHLRKSTTESFEHSPQFSSSPTNSHARDDGEALTTRQGRSLTSFITTPFTSLPSNSSISSTRPSLSLNATISPFHYLTSCTFSPENWGSLLLQQWCGRMVVLDQSLFHVSPNSQRSTHCHRSVLHGWIRPSMVLVATCHRSTWPLGWFGLQTGVALRSIFLCEPRDLSL